MRKYIKASACVADFEQQQPENTPGFFVFFSSFFGVVARVVVGRRSTLTLRPYTLN
jgi:hypothetical protein